MADSATQHGRIDAHLVPMEAIHLVEHSAPAVTLELKINLIIGKRSIIFKLVLPHLSDLPYKNTFIHLSKVVSSINRHENDLTAGLLMIL
jgi:hypothetical protein